MQDKSPEASAGAIPALAENSFATEVYADCATSFCIKGGNVCITFASTRFDNGAQPPVARNVVIGRLVMPALGAHGLAVGLFDYLKKHGIDPDRQQAPAN